MKKMVCWPVVLSWVLSLGNTEKVLAQQQWFWKHGAVQIVVNQWTSNETLPHGRTSLEHGTVIKGNILDEIKPLKLEVLVMWAFYKPLWFLGLMLILIVVVGFWIARMRSLLLQHQNLHIQQKVEEKTAELVAKTETVMQQAHKIEQVERYRTKLFVDINHELRTPLTLINWSIKALSQDEQLSTTGREQMDNIKNNIEQLILLANEIIQLARQEESTLLNEQIIDFKDFIQSASLSFHTWAANKNIEYKLNMELGEMAQKPMLLDESKLQKILNNLITNALKYCRDGNAVNLNVQIKNYSLHIEVIDTGLSIANEELENIGQWYSQAKNSKETNALGFGIGLAITQELVEAMGGILELSGKVGEGTKAYLVVPYKVVEKKAIEAHTNAEAEKVEEELRLEATVYLEGSKILLVEDIAEVRQYLHSFLSPYYEIVEAQDGVEALERLKEGRFDLIISDVMMPKMNGFELLQNVRQNKSMQMIPFLILTVRAESQDQMRALRLGVDRYLTKPFERVELLARVHNLLINQQLRRNSPPNTTVDGALEQVEAAKSINRVNQWWQKLEALVNEHLTSSELKITDLAYQMAVSERTLRDRIREHTGWSPKQYLLEVRLAKAKLLLENKVFASVAEVSYAVGIKTPSYFARLYKKRYGKSPSEY
ncbi:response regulator [Haliscomenobacter sp.]|uniref:hybrid sensor histidine kinase/response regulator transcription factor n=1 Tax=Haliscomenobacter sp. TaxID=2717303 RepID=UPI003BAABACF